MPFVTALLHYLLSCHTGHALGCHPGLYHLGMSKPGGDQSLVGQNGFNGRATDILIAGLS